MATDLETLVVQMSADFKSYENAFAKASGVTKQQLAGIKADATAAGGASVVAFDQGARAAAKFGNQARAVGGNVRVLQAQTGNLAAQFQDIGVQLAGGQSPFLIALQQGTQISAVLGGQGAGGAVKALGAAFASVVSPVSLVTIGLIAAGGAAVQYFASLLGSGGQSEAELKKQSQLIQQIANDWSDTVPSLAAYAEKLKEARSEAELLQGVKIAQEGIAAGVVGEFEALTDTLTETLHLVPDANREFGVLAGRVASGSATTDDFQRVIDAFNDSIFASEALIQAAVVALQSMQDRAAGASIEMSILGTEAEIAAGKIQRASAAFQAAEAMRKSAMPTVDPTDAVVEQIRAENAATSEQLDLQREIESVKGRVAAAGGIIGDLEAETLATEIQSAEAARKAADAAAREAASKAKGGGGGGGSDAAAKAAEREREAVTKLIEQLQFEQSLIGLTAVEKEKLTALRRAGGAATDAERAQIAQLVEESYNEVEAIKAVEDRMNELRAVSSDVLHGMFEDMRDGVEGAELLANALNRVAESFVSAGIDRLITGAFPVAGAAPAATGTGGIFGGRIIPGWLHRGGVAGAGGYHGRAISPAVFQGAQRYHNGGVAGLRPGEVPAILQRGERVIPKGGGSGGVVLNYAPVINAPNSDAAGLARLEAVVRAQAVQFRDQTIRTVGDPRFRGSL